MGEKWLQEFLGPCFFPVLKKKKRPRNSWTLFIFEPFSPMSGTPFPFIPLPDIFQHHRSGNSFRWAKGSLYWSRPTQIPSKCWGCSNLIFLTRCPLSQACPVFRRGASEEPTHLPVPEIPAAGHNFFQPWKVFSDTIFLQSGEDPVRSQFTSLPLASLLLDSAFCQGWGKKRSSWIYFLQQDVQPSRLVLTSNPFG